MFIIACLIWIGITLSAPTWFYILLGIAGVFKLISLGISLGKISK